MSRFSTIAVMSLCALLLPFNVFAQLNKPPKPPAPTSEFPEGTRPIVRPLTERLPLKSQIKLEVFDDITLQLWSVEGGDFGMKMPPYRNLVEIQRAKHESIAFTLRDSTDLRIEWAIFGRTEFMPDLKDESLWGYGLGQKQRLAPDEFVVLNPDFFWADRGLPIAGNMWRQLQYKTINKELNQETGEEIEIVQQYRDILFFDGKFFVLISMSGPPSDVERYSPQLITRLSDATAYVPGAAAE